MSKLNTYEQEVIFTLAENVIGVSQKGQYRKDILVRNVERRMEDTNRDCLEDYLKFANQDKKEYPRLISALTIHTTRWFREKPHYDRLEKYVLKNIQNFKGKTFHLLSAACSTGEEVYSMAILMMSIKERHPEFEFEVRGIDIDPVSVSHGKKGIYYRDHIEHIPSEYHKYVRLGKGRAENYFTLDPEIKKRCNFGVGSLVKADYFENRKYHSIFCRNVLIYFQPESVDMITKSLVDHLEKDGVLTLGHSEAMMDPTKFKLEIAWNSSYRFKVDRPKIQAKNSILVVDDSATVRRVLEKLFGKHGFDVVTAESAAEATKVLSKRRVDLISLDLHMPEKDGKTWLKEQRSQGLKTPVIIITDANAAESQDVLGALENGAQDYLNKSALNKDEDLVVEKIKILIETQKTSKVGKRVINLKKQKLFYPDLILIGSSTGGTEALSKLLANFSIDSPPVLVVQHISHSFALAFAKRLATVSGLELGKTMEGTVLEKGKIYLSDGDYHIGIKKAGPKYKLINSNQIPVNRHRPSVEYLFDSAMKVADKCAAVMLTGMGKDGAQAMMKLQMGGAMTFCQDEQSSVVFGMPGEAIKLGVNGFIGNLREIRGEMDKFLRSK